MGNGRYSWLLRALRTSEEEMSRILILILEKQQRSLAIST